MKELVISGIIVVLIVVCNVWIGSFIDGKLDHIIGLLDDVIPLLESEEYAEAEGKIYEINDYLEESEGALSCYIEHDELEKVQSSLTVLNSYVRMESDDAFSEANDMSFIIKHIKEKDDLKVKNIF